MGLRVDVKASDTQWGLEVRKGREVKRSYVGIWQEPHAMPFNTVCNMLIRLFKATHRTQEGASSPTRLRLPLQKQISSSLTTQLYRTANWTHYKYSSNVDEMSVTHEP